MLGTSIAQRPAGSLEEFLVSSGTLGRDALDRALRVRDETGERLHLILPKLGLVSELDMASTLARHLGLAVATGADYPDEPILDACLSTRFLKEARAVPIEDGPQGVVLAMADPLNDYVVDAVRVATGQPVERRVALPTEIDAAFDRLYGQGRTSIQQLAEDASSAGDKDDIAAEDVERLKDLASEAPVIRLVNLLVNDAVEARASDIHIEPFENKLRVRYRIDGLLHEIEPPPSRLAQAVISRVKILAKLNIAERRLPQDGRIKVALRGHEIDLRVSTTPGMHGESVVLRILDRSRVELDFRKLGFGDDVLNPFLSILDRPHGIVLVTGPTGSGKTTTLYTCLRRLSTPDRKVLTVEDPIEYQLDGVVQVAVKPEIGLTFAKSLRSFLRQDPDIIMIGEIRDLETAQIAIQSALTGHLVLSTLHTNDAASAVTRLLDMGMEDYLLTSTVNGIVAQRLVRRLCPQCREPYELVPELHGHLGATAPALDGAERVYRARGCEHCGNAGYLGRTTIAEVLVMTDDVRRLVLQRSDARAIERAAAKEGMRSLYEHGMAKVLAGETTVEEVLRVTRGA